MVVLYGDREHVGRVEGMWILQWKRRAAFHV